jgi:hypothetical protein
MRLVPRNLAVLFLTSALAIPIATTGCAEHHYVRVYDPYYSDYHEWNAGEDAAYRRWINERHYEYREYNKLDKEKQKEYWDWRHSHPDNR